MADPIVHFKKLAKQFHALVEAGDAKALPRIQAVFRDKPEPFGLMKAQHLIAVEHGFKSWDDLLEHRPIALQLAIVMAEIPDLNDFGIGIFRERRKLSPDELRVHVEEQRQALRNSVHRVEATVAWLKDNIERRKTVNTRRTSYGMKHTAETDLGYITNGVFIAAAIIAGYPYKIEWDSPNVPFAMSDRSFSKIARDRLHKKRNTEYAGMTTKYGRDDNRRDDGRISTGNVHSISLQTDSGV